MRVQGNARVMQLVDVFLVRAIIRNPNQPFYNLGTNTHITLFYCHSIILLSLTNLNGLNINFFTLFGEFDANIYFGGDNVIFWGPLAWTVIYGLIVATFLTLIIVPILFFLITTFKMWLRHKMKPNTQTELIH